MADLNWCLAASFERFVAQQLLTLHYLKHVASVVITATVVSTASVTLLGSLARCVEMLSTAVLATHECAIAARLMSNSCFTPDCFIS
jgi:hypothetical protein